MRIFVATSNTGKLREFQTAARELGFGEIEIEAFNDFRSLPGVEETGETFAENAAIKAEHFSGFTSEMVFADDSGIEVDALGGEPGVYSARYAGPDATDDANNALLLKRMSGVENRSARFVCVISVAQDGRQVASFRGTVEGRLLDAPRGTNGFGYDPLFFYPPRNCTTAELPKEEKILISHRGKALRQMLEWLRRTGG